MSIPFVRTYAEYTERYRNRSDCIFIMKAIGKHTDELYEFEFHSGPPLLFSNLLHFPIAGNCYAILRLNKGAYLLYDINDKIIYYDTLKMIEG